jgi:ribonuclease VapC
VKVVVDSSVLLAIEFAEPSASRCAAALTSCDELVMSTVNLTEVLIRAGDRRPDALAALSLRLERSGIRFVPPDLAQARVAAEARLRLPLNLGDCFAYALAIAEGCAILTLDEDFRRTDVAVIVP